MDNNLEYDDKNSNESDNRNFSKLVDIRIILTNLDYIEAVSKAVSNFDLSNFNVNISSIIPTSDIEIAKNTIVGADLVLVAAPPDFEGKELYSKFKKALKNDYNYIEYLKLPSLDELDDYDYDYEGENSFEDEIANSIIRAGLYSISDLSSIIESRRAYHKIKKDFDASRLKFDKINKENDILLNESKAIREKNEKLREEVKILQKDLDNIKSDFSDLKSRFESIHSRNSLEVFSLMELWESLFNETFTEEIYRFILISTDNFRPKNLMIGQGAICAESKEDALDWLKIIKTAFILSDTNKKELDFKNFNSNFKFELDEFNASYDDGSFEDSSINKEDSSFLSKGFFDDEEDSSNDDGFIYNERFEKNDDYSNINVFNIKSLNSFDKPSNDESNSDDDFVEFDDSNSDDDFVEFDDSESSLDENNSLDSSLNKRKTKEDDEDYEDYTLDFDDDYESPFSQLW